MAEVPGGADVVLESTFGWYWAVDLLQELGFTVHLSNPYGNDWGHRRVKNDERDARDLADLCRLGRLAEAWIAPSYVRELRELVRFRAKLGQLRTGLKAQVQAVMGKHAVLPVRVNMWGTTGQAQLDALELPPAYTHRLTVLRELVKTYDAKIAEIDREVHAILRDDVGYNALQSIFGIGPVFAAIFIAEIGDVTRFSSPEALCSWAGLTPKHRESDGVVHRGRITKQGSALVRWAAIESVTRYHGGSHFAASYLELAARRGRNKAKVAIARRVLTLAFYALRDGEVRCLQAQQAA